MQYVPHNKSIITGKENLQPLYTFRNYPVFFWCVDSPREQDVVADMSWAICPESWVIQLDKLIPLEVLYQEQHVDGTWPTWAQYYKDFAAYIWEKAQGNILEIGWGMWKLAKEVLGNSSISDYTVIEPNPIIEENEKLHIIKWFFDGNTKIDKKIWSVIFSQVLEHIYDPNEFIANIHSFLEMWDSLIFAYPNLKKWLENKYTNAINYEHCMFLTDYFVDVLIQKHWFEIIDKTFYKDHSIFYTCKKSTKRDDISFENKYTEYKKIFDEYIWYYDNLIQWLQEKITNFKWEIYIFWGHIFSQHLIVCGLPENRIQAVLDNSPLKNKRRLYGTNLIVEYPWIIEWKKEVAVILKAWIYQEEIKKQLKELNSDVLILE